MECHDLIYCQLSKPLQETLSNILKHHHIFNEVLLSQNVAAKTFQDKLHSTFMVSRIYANELKTVPLQATRNYTDH